MHFSGGGMHFDGVASGPIHGSRSSMLYPDAATLMDAFDNDLHSVCVVLLVAIVRCTLPAVALYTVYLCTCYDARDAGIVFTGVPLSVCQSVRVCLSRNLHRKKTADRKLM